MPIEAPPESVFREAALKSGLLTEDQWRLAVDAVGNEAAKLGEFFVREGFLTAYQATQLQAGRSKLNLGPYRITEWIGQGGMGQVFKAVHTVMGRHSAVKVLPLEKSTPESRESFLREIRLQAGLDCPYLVRAFDAGHDGKVHYLVTEYVPGTDLRRLVRMQGPLPTHQAASIIRQAALGLHYAHELGLIHRDVKPGNILVTPDGHAKLSDVGMATWSLGLASDPKAGKIVGTADYLSPEQIRTPLSVRPTSDIYALGCTLYYAVTGKVPYPGGDARSKCRRHLEETPWHPRRFTPELPEDFVELIADMMEKDPQRRIASAAEVAERLLPWCSADTQTIPAPPTRSSWMPAPPPAEPAPLHADPDRESPSQISLDDQRSSVGRSDLGQSGLGAGDSSLSSLPIPPPIPASGELSGAAASNPMLVPLVLAIAIPISLFVGAIIGFLVGINM